MPDLPREGTSEEPRRVRSVEPEDERALLDLWRETWAATYGRSLGVEALDAMVRGLDRGTAALLPGRGERGQVLVQGRRLVGSAVAAERGGVAYLWGMYVRPALQRSGVGSALLAAVARDLAGSIELEARVLATSLEAQAFYRARGFRVVGHETTEIVGSVSLPTLVLRAEVARLRDVLG